MTRPPTWTILVATLAQRHERFSRLVDILTPQLDEFNGAVRLIAYRNSGETTLGHVRQSLVEAADGDYVSFIDDDDTVPDYFVSEIVHAIAGHVVEHGTTPDYVGWRMQVFLNGETLKPTFHSLRYDHWWDDVNGYYRDISHLNPIRRELALQADFRRTQPPEDVAWSDQLRGKVKTETYVDRVMYLYHASSSDSTWRPGAVTPGGEWDKVSLDSPHMSYHPGSTS